MHEHISNSDYRSFTHHSVSVMSCLSFLYSLEQSLWNCFLLSILIFTSVEKREERQITGDIWRLLLLVCFSKSWLGFNLKDDEYSYVPTHPINTVILCSVFACQLHTHPEWPDTSQTLPVQRAKELISSFSSTNILFYYFRKGKKIAFSSSSTQSPSVY